MSARTLISPAQADRLIESAELRIYAAQRIAEADPFNPDALQRRQNALIEADDLLDVALSRIQGEQEARR